jgi:hypothetical protein
MDSKEFWAAVDEIYNQFHGSDNTGVGFFISDLEKILDEWDSTEHEYKF